MSNKEEIKTAEVEVKTTAETNAKVEKKPEQKNDKKKAKKNKEKKVNAASKTLSELKKVSWPNFKTVVKQTSVVIVKPGGTGIPNKFISARLAPLPPRRFLISALPSALPSPNV